MLVIGLNSEKWMQLCLKSFFYDCVLVENEITVKLSVKIVVKTSKDENKQLHIMLWCSTLRRFGWRIFCCSSSSSFPSFDFPSMKINEKLQIILNERKIWMQILLLHKRKRWEKSFFLYRIRYFAKSKQTFCWESHSFYQKPVKNRDLSLWYQIPFFREKWEKNFFQKVKSKFPHRLLHNLQR